MTTVSSHQILFCGKSNRNLLIYLDDNKRFSNLFDFSKTVTLPFETRKNMECFALSPCGNMLVCVDVEGRAILINLRKRVSRIVSQYWISSDYPFLVIFLHSTQRNILATAILCFTMEPCSAIMKSIFINCCISHLSCRGLQHSKQIIPLQVLLAHHNFKKPVSAISYSPDGAHIAVSHGKHVQLWCAPGTSKEFTPFTLVRTYPGQYDEVRGISA